MAEVVSSGKPKSERNEALEVVRRLRDAGHVAYFAGGCVRDLLLGREPKDYDVATDAPPQRVRSLFSNTQAVGAAFGVILVRLARCQIEVATFRADGSYLDGRRPSEVRFTTAEEDARRRDFTINGLFLDPVDDRVIDYVGGQEDLRAKRIRAIGDPSARFDEDSLRLLRAVRFSARFGFAIEPGTADAVRRHAPQLKRISPERIADELRAMLTPDTRFDAWSKLWELELAGELFRYLPAGDRRHDPEQPLFFRAVAPGESVPFALALAAAVMCYRMQTDSTLADVRALFSRAEVHTAVQALRKSLKISNEESEQVRGALADLEPLLADAEPTLAMKKRFLASATAPLSRALMSALERYAGDLTSIPESASRHVQLRETAARIDILQGEFAQLEQTEYAPEPLVNGDVLKELGLTPGPLFKRILDTVYDAQLDGRVATREDAVEMALELARGN